MKNIRNSTSSSQSLSCTRRFFCTRSVEVEAAVVLFWKWRTYVWLFCLWYFRSKFQKHSFRTKWKNLILLKPTMAVMNTILSELTKFSYQKFAWNLLKLVISEWILIIKKYVTFTKMTCMNLFKSKSIFKI